MSQPEQPTQFNYDVLMARIHAEARRLPRLDLSRRGFIKAMGAGAALAVFGWTLPNSLQAARYKQAVNTTPGANAALPNGIAAGDTTATSTVIWARAAAAGALTVELSTAPDFASIEQTHTATVTDAMQPAKLEISGLTPATQYYYRVVAEDGSTLTGRFRTYAEIGSKTGLRFGVSGDWRGELRPYMALRNVPAADLDFFVAHGDTIYADYPTEAVPAEQCVTLEDYRKKHAEIYSEALGLNLWADIRAVTSMYATIDDHEVTNDFAGGAAPASDERFADETVAYINQSALYRNGMQAFSEYHPTRALTYEGTGDDRVDGRPKLYRYVTFGSDAALFIIDARSFRDASKEGTMDFLNRGVLNAYLDSLFEEGRTMLGRPQVEELKRDLLAAHNAGITWKFVMMPEPVQQQGWLGGNDRWEGYAPERTEVLKFIEDNGIKNVVFIAADVHTTYVNDLYYQTEARGELIPTHMWEISTGSVAFYPPTGAQLVAGAAEFGLIPGTVFENYQKSNLIEKDRLLESLFNSFVLGLQGYEKLGLNNEEISVTQEVPGWVHGHSFGWTMFEIDADTQALTVTTFGVPAYGAEDLAQSPEAVLGLEPQIMGKFTVAAV